MLLLLHGLRKSCLLDAAIWQLIVDDSIGCREEFSGQKICQHQSDSTILLYIIIAIVAFVVSVAAVVHATC